MTERLLSPTWLSTLSQYTRLVVAYSGGSDSSALLHAIATELSGTASVVALHVNHGLSSYAEDWEQCCKSYCNTLGIDFFSSKVIISSNSNIEACARKARYNAIKEFVKEGDAVLMAHHALDQTETLLLNLLRGSGIEGLSAIPHTAPIGEAVLHRPLLEIPKTRIDGYCRTNNVLFIKDSSNTDTRFNRNYIRHELLPIIRKRWPAFEKSITRSINHCQQAKRNLTALAQMDRGENNSKCNKLSLEGIKKLPFDRQINTLRQWFIEQHTQCPSEVIILRILKELMLAKTDASPCVSWGNKEVRRYQSHLYLMDKLTDASINAQVWKNFPNEHYIQELDKRIGIKNPNQLHLKEPFIIRSRVGGESIHIHGHHRSLKKLMQQWQVPPWERAKLPLIYAQDKLIAVVGYAKADTVPAPCSFYTY